MARVIQRGGQGCAATRPNPAAWLPHCWSTLSVKMRVGGPRPSPFTPSAAHSARKAPKGAGEGQKIPGSLHREVPVVSRILFRYRNMLNTMGEMVAGLGSAARYMGGGGRWGGLQMKTKLPGSWKLLCRSWGLLLLFFLHLGMFEIFHNDEVNGGIKCPRPPQTWAIQGPKSRGKAGGVLASLARKVVPREGDNRQGLAASIPDQSWLAALPATIQPRLRPARKETEARRRADGAPGLHSSTAVPLAGVSGGPASGTQWKAGWLSGSGQQACYCRGGRKSRL